MNHIIKLSGIRRFFLFNLFVWSFLGASTQTLSENVDAYLKSTSTKKNKFNGTALVSVNGEILLYGGYGFKNKETGALNDTGTAFQIGSITKTFTSAVVLRYYERKKLDIDDKLDKYLPGFPNGDKISIRHLLTNTSGIPDYLAVDKYGKENFSNPISREKLISFFKDGKLAFEPGTRFAYSNSGYILLARIIEIVGGKRFEDILRQEILQPLDMSGTGFDFVSLPDSNKAKNYTDIRSRHPESVPVFDSTHAPGCGNMYSTVGDLYKWDRALCAGSILSIKSQKLAYTPDIEIYGLGWFTDTVYGKFCVFHGGGTPGFRSQLQRFPDQGVSIALLSNNANCDLYEISNRIAAIIFQTRYRPLKLWN